jgi:hypothetical protein
LPRFACVGIPLRVTGGLERSDAHLVTHDVVRVRIATVLVVRRQHVRLEVTDHPHEDLGRLHDRDHSEATFGQGWLRVALGPARVHETEPVLAHAEDLPGPVHLLAPDLGDVLEHVGTVHLRVEDRAALATGAGRHVDVHAFGDVLRGAGRALARLVVGVGVDVHQTQHDQHRRLVG